jgi:hypothetical protein
MNIDKPRQYSLVKFNFDALDEKFFSQLPFTREGVYVFFGEIPNMPGHCIVADHKTGLFRLSRKWTFRPLELRMNQLPLNG